MLLLLLLLLEADRERLGRLVRLSPRTLKSIAGELGMSSENLQGSLSGRRPLPTGERLTTLQRAVGISIKTGNLDNNHVFQWEPKARTLVDFVAMTAEMFPKGRSTFRTDLIFGDLGYAVHFCIHSDDFVVVLSPCSGLSLSHLVMEDKHPIKLTMSLEQFCAMPADEARAILRKGKVTWNDAVTYLKTLNIHPEQAMEWGAEVEKSQANARNSTTAQTE